MKAFMVDSSVLGFSGTVLQAWRASTAAGVPGTVEVDCTKLAPTTMLMTRAAAAQVRSRNIVATIAFMASSLTGSGRLEVFLDAVSRVRFLELRWPDWAAFHGVILY